MRVFEFFFLQIVREKATNMMTYIIIKTDHKAIIEIIIQKDTKKNQ